MILYTAPGGGGAPVTQFWKLEGLGDDTIINTQSTTGGVHIQSNKSNGVECEASFNVPGAPLVMIRASNNIGVQNNGMLRYDANGAPPIGDIWRLQMYDSAPTHDLSAVEVTRSFAQLQTDQSPTGGQKVEARVVAASGGAFGTFQIIGNNAIQFYIRENGQLHTNQTQNIAPLNPATKMMPIYDEFNALVGYIQIHTLI